MPVPVHRALPSAHPPTLSPTHPLTGQVAHEPALAPALSELIDSCKGTELYLRRPERYGLNGGAHSFAEVGGLTGAGSLGGPAGGNLGVRAASLLCGWQVPVVDPSQAVLIM